MARRPFEVGPFTEGLNMVDPPIRLSPGEAQLLSNTFLGDRGNWFKRSGHEGYGSSPAKINGDNLVNFLHRYYKADGSKKLVGAAGGKLRFGTDTTGAWTDISINGTGASMHSTNLMDQEVYKDRLYITDGTKPVRYNGTDAPYAGHFSYAAPTLAGAGGGAKTALGTYKYRVASVQGDMGEGPYGAEATITLVGGQNTVNLSNINDPPAMHEATAKRIYGTKNGGTIFYFIAEIPIGTTTYSDQAADTALVQEYIPVHNPADETRFVIVGHDERGYWFGRTGINASLVEVSEPGFITRIIDGSGFFTVANNDGDKVTGGVKIPSGIVFFKRNSMWLVRGFGFPPINIRPHSKRGGGVGTLSHFSAVWTPVGLIFLSQQGEMYLFDGTNLTEIGRNRIAPEFTGLPEATLNRVVACYHDGRYQISYDQRATKGYNWRTLTYKVFEGKWEGPHDGLGFDGAITTPGVVDLYTPSYYAVWDSALDKGELAWGEGKAANGSFARIRTEFSKKDRGVRFTSRVITGAKKIESLSEDLIYKAFLHGEASTDATVFIHLEDEKKNRTTVQLNVPTPVDSGIWSSPSSNWGPDASGAKWADIKPSVLEGSLESSARSRVATFEVSDGGTATTASFDTMEILVDSLPLK